MSAAQVPVPRSLADDRGGAWVRHWQHPQWRADVDRWVHRSLAEHQLHPTGPAVTYKIRFWSVVRCYPTDAGLCWFKENNPGQAFEATLVARLDALAGELNPAIPVSLDHNDLHAHNVFGGIGDTLRFFDFGDSVWGHPFSTMRSFALSLAGTADLPEVTELVEAYLSAWSDLADPEVLRREYRLAAALLPVTRVVSWYRLLDHADVTETAAWVASPRYWLGEVASAGEPGELATT